MQGADSPAHLDREKNTVLTAGTTSRRGTRLSSIHILECTSGWGGRTSPAEGRSSPPSSRLNADWVVQQVRLGKGGEKAANHPRFGMLSRSPLRPAGYTDIALA